MKSEIVTIQSLIKTLCVVLCIGKITGFVLNDIKSSCKLNYALVLFIGFYLEESLSISSRSLN